MSEEIINRVAASGIVTFDLEDYFQKGAREVLDIQPLLEGGLVLREKSFREYVRQQDWSTFQDKHVAIQCSADAIVPVWAYMLLASSLQPFVRTVVFGDLEKLEERIFLDALTRVDWSSFSGARVVVKGCSKVDVPASVFVEVTTRLKPFVASIMFGEACSSVPVFKKK